MLTVKLKMSESSLSKIPYWDGKTECFGVYVSKIEAHAEFISVGDALVLNFMVNCPTQSEFAAIDVTKPENLILVDVYTANMKLYTIIALGQGKNHGIAFLSQT
jgi:hypothetical protein